jgi:hypothetical protein
MNSKRRVYVPSVKPLRTPLLDRINQVIIEEQTSTKIESQNHPEEKYCHSKGVVSGGRNSETRK